MFATKSTRPLVTLALLIFPSFIAARCDAPLVIGTEENGTSGSAGTSSAETCPKEACGAAAIQPSYLCDDGTWGGPTGRCVRNEDDSCGWEYRQCTPDGGAGGATSVDPCDGVALPECQLTCTDGDDYLAHCGEPCSVEGDSCGNEIGDARTCSGGVWNCAVHPPLGGPGVCNLVCRSPATNPCDNLPTCKQCSDGDAPLSHCGEPCANDGETCTGEYGEGRICTNGYWACSPDRAPVQPGECAQVCEMPGGTGAGGASFGDGFPSGGTGTGGATSSDDLPVGGSGPAEDEPVGGASSVDDLPVGGASSVDDLPVGGASSIDDLPVGGASSGN